MAHVDLSTRLGPIHLRSPLIAASGTVGSVIEWAAVADVSHYGAAVAKSVSLVPWPGRPAPRLAPAASGMLNGIGIQNPGVAAWIGDVSPRLLALGVPAWGSAVGEDPEEFAVVARSMERAGVPVVEVNLSCPNLDNGQMFSFDSSAAGRVISTVRAAVTIPVIAKLSPNTPDILAVAVACVEAGADGLTLTNTALGYAIDVETRRPALSGGVGGYSGPPLRPISLRCVHEVARALPHVPIIGCGGVNSGRDVVEYLLAGASAVALGSVHLAEPKAGGRISRELTSLMTKMGAVRVPDLVGGVRRP